MLLFLTGFFLVGQDVVREGFGQPWYDKAIGLVMLGGFSILLTWIFLRGFSRDQVWITEDTLQIRRSWLVWKRDSLWSNGEIEAFEFSATNDVFDIWLRVVGKESIPVVCGHRSEELESWSKALSDIAPVRPQQAKAKPAPNKRTESNG